MSEVRRGRRRRSPGPLGYALSVLISLVVLGLELGVVAAVQDGSLGALLVMPVLALVFGAVPAATLGLLGTVTVHLLTLHTDRQAWHVATAALVGVVLGVMWFHAAPGEGITFGLMLGVATGIGRLAVIPLQPRSYIVMPLHDAPADGPVQTS